MKYIIALPKPKNMLYFGLLLMILKVFIPLSDVLPQSIVFDNILSFTSAGILAIDVILKKLSIKRLIVYSVITILSLYTSIVTEQYGFLITVVAVMAIANYDFDSIIYFIYRWELILFVTHMGIALLYNFLPGVSIVQIIGDVKRFNFGFGHPNTFSAYLFNLIIMWIWLHYKTIVSKDVIQILLIELVSYVFTRTRTSLIDVFVLCIILLIAKRYEINTILSTIAKFIVPFFSAFIFILVILFITKNPVVLFLDKLVSSRIRLGAYAYYFYKPTLFGQNIPFSNVTWDSFWQLNGLTFDCTYTSLIMMQGIVWLIILSIGFFLLGRMKNNKISIAIIAWALYAITEIHGINGFMCFPVLLLSILLKPKNRIKTAPINTVGKKNDKYYSANL